jgi:hypothetical protein
LILLPSLAWSYPATGSHGFGMTVFQGRDPQRFEVEILGVLERAGSTGDLILARLSGGPLEETGVLQGMSGSPVWVGDELVGAVAATWAFAKEPMALIRPIGEMRKLRDYLDQGQHPTWSPGDRLAPAPDAVTTPVPFDQARELRALGLSDASEKQDTRPAPLKDDLWPLGRVEGLSWSESGLSAPVREALERRMGISLAPALSVAAVASGGKDTPGKNTEQETKATAESEVVRPGDAVAVLLVSGDAQLAATGTVSEIDGDDLLAFGHPFLGAGPVSLPMYEAEVVGVLPSRQISFKLTNPTREIGALLLDRPTGVAGRLGVHADTMPVEVEVTGESGESHLFHYQVARHPSVGPPLVYWCVQNSLSALSDLSTLNTAQMSLELDIQGEEPLKSEAAVTGLETGGALAKEVLLPLNLLTFNPGHSVRVEKTKLSLTLRRGRQSANVDRVRVRPARPKPSDTLTVGVELLPYRSEPQWAQFSLTLPADLPEGQYVLHISDGTTAFATELSRAQQRWSYPGLRPIREAFAKRRPANTLVAVLYGRPASAVVQGREWENLPESVRSVMQESHGSEGNEGVKAAVILRREKKTDWVLSGDIVFPLTIANPEHGHQDSGSSQNQ